MKFVKMHGIGNDYVFVDVFDQEVGNPSETARLISPRHYSIGSDGLILIGPSEIADAKMRIFNADGFEAEMCGNGIRCVAKYLWEHGPCKKNPLKVETLAGIKELQLTVEGGSVKSVCVDMGKPELRRSEIPMSGPETDCVLNEPISVGKEKFSATCVSMGNPHCIIPVEKLSDIDVKELGPAIENHELFPERTNVHFAKVLSKNEVEVITWERGSGVTLACGTGASAVCVAMHLMGLTEREVVTRLPGGDLEIKWCSRSGTVYMTGPAVEVFRGCWAGEI